MDGCLHRLGAVDREHHEPLVTRHHRPGDGVVRVRRGDGCLVRQPHSGERRLGEYVRRAVILECLSEPHRSIDLRVVRIDDPVARPTLRHPVGAGSALVHRVQSGECTGASMTSPIKLRAT